MVNRPMTGLAKVHEQFGYQSTILGAAFVVIFMLGIFFGSDGLLEYFRVISGRPTITLETGAILMLASAIPFLGMGMAVRAKDEELADGAR